MFLTLSAIHQAVDQCWDLNRTWGQWGQWQLVPKCLPFKISIPAGTFQWTEESLRPLSNGADSFLSPAVLTKLVLNVPPSYGSCCRWLADLALLKQWRMNLHLWRSLSRIYAIMILPKTTQF